MEEKRVPVVGDTWAIKRWSSDVAEVTIVSLGKRAGCACEAHVRCLLPGGHEDDGWCEGTFAKIATFVRSAAPPKERDWRQWIPPENWRGTKQKLRAGQIIAWRMTAIGEVVLMEDADRGRVLATNSMYDGSDHTSGLWSIETVIVADVGCEPTDPSVLYGKPASPPVVEAPRLAQRPTALSKCPVCSGLMVANVIHGCPNYGRALMLEQGPGIAPMLANPCRLVACGHRACLAASTEPWRSNFDDADLMGRDV